jgi:ferritin-like metal-binding protein YciE
MKHTKTSTNGRPTGRKTTTGRTAASRAATAKRGPAHEQDGMSGMENSDLHKLFVDALGDMYYAEKKLVKALPKMEKAAQNEDLKEGFANHLRETEEHVQRCEQAFESIGMKAKAKKCDAMDGLVEEAEGMMKDFKGTDALDAALIAAAQKVEHYEIASYGALVTWAEQMGHDEAADLLRTTLEEEKACDEHLTEIATSGVNAEAE